MEIILRVCPSVRGEELNTLFAGAWPDHRHIDWQPILNHVIVYVCAYESTRLVGFAKVVGDGGVHGFLLDPTVAPDKQKQGIGRQLVAKCSDEARSRGIEWLHVDFEPHLKAFYESCGLKHTEAGLLNLNTKPALL